MKKNLHLNNSLFILPVIILTLSIFFRFWKLGSIPVGLYWDEIAMYVDAKTISHNLKDMHGHYFLQPIFISYGDYKLPVFILLASMSFKLFGASEFALRLPSALIGVLQGVFIFFFLQSLTKKIVPPVQSLFSSLVGWFIFAVSPWSILFSRTGFEGFTGQFFMTIAVCTLFLSQKRKAWLSLTLLCSILAVYSYYSVRFVWPVVLISFILLYLVPQLYERKKNIQHNLDSVLKGVAPYILTFILFFLGLLPMMYSPLYEASQQYRLSATSLIDILPYIQESNRLQEKNNNSLISKVFYHQRILQLKDLAKHYSDHLDLNYLFISGDANLRHGTGEHGLFLLYCLPLLIAGIFYLLKKDKTLLTFLFIWWMIALLPASVPTDTPHALRSLNALTPIVIILAFGSIPILLAIAKLKKDQTKWVLSSAIISIMLFQIISFGVDYFSIYPQKSAPSWQSGYKELTEVMMKQRKGMKDVWVSTAEDKLYLWYLAYSDIPVETIQSLQYEGYQIKRADNIYFKNFIWTNNPELPYLVITDKQEPEKQPTRQEILRAMDGSVQFRLNYYENTQ